MEKVKLGILSHAHGHANIYCNALQHFPDARLVACWDDNPARGQRAADQFGMQYRPEANALLEDPEINAVIITTETNRHAEFVERAAAAGKHILCQKPLATTLEDCDRIIKAVAQHNVKFSMAYQMRHDPVNQKIKELLDHNAVGQIFSVRRRHSIGVLLNDHFGTGETAWHVDPEANVGMYFDDSIHACDFLYWMLGAPKSVMAEIDRIVVERSPDDTGVALYRFSKGEIGVLFNSSTTVAAVSTTEIYGTEGTIQHDYGDGPSTGVPRPADAVALRLIRQGEKEWTEFPIPIPQSHAERIAAVPRPFIDYVRDLSDETISAEEGRTAVEMALGAYRSTQEGRRIHFPL
jgi:predicted dehydrogenase